MFLSLKLLAIYESSFSPLCIDAFLIHFVILKSLDCTLIAVNIDTVSLSEYLICSFGISNIINSPSL